MVEVKKRTAVYIDDDKVLLQVMGAYASHTKHVNMIGSFADPIEGLKAIDDLKPDILFLDVQLKEIDAFAIIEALDYNPMIIGVSSHWESEEDLIYAGASSFLAKPLKGPDQIDEAVEKALAFDREEVKNIKKPKINFTAHQEELPELHKESLTQEPILADGPWAIFIDQFEHQHPTFFEKLNDDCKSLTPQQLRICAYAKIGVSLKNISSHIELKLESVQAQVLEIKQKLDIEPTDDLREFLSIYN